MKKNNYAFLICLCGTLIIMCTSGLTLNGFYPYIPFIEAQGYTGIQTSSLVTIRCLVSLICMNFSYLFYQRFRLRIGLISACSIVAIAFLIMGLADNYLLFAFASALMGVSYAFGGIIPISILINNWFHDRQATAISVCTAGTGVSSLIMPHVVTYMVSHYSISKAFFTSAALALVIMIVVVVFVWDTPHEKSSQPYIVDSSSMAEKTSSKVQAFQIILPPKKKALLLVDIALLGGITMAASAHFTALFITEGYSATFTATVLSVSGLVLIISKCLFGIIVDKLGSITASFSFLLILTVSLLGSYYIRASFFFAVAVSILSHIGFAPSTAGIPIWAKDFSTPPQQAKTLRSFQVAYSAGGMLLSSFPGMIFDITGRYVLSYLFCFFAIAIFSMVLMFLYHSDSGRKSVSKETSF